AAWFLATPELSHERMTSRLRSLGRFTGGCCVGAVAVLVPVLIAGDTGAMFRNTLSRTDTSGNVGGLGFGGIRHFKRFAWLLTTAQRHAPLVTRGSLLFQIGGAAVLTIWVWRTSGRSPAFALVGAAACMFAWLVASTPG